MADQYDGFDYEEAAKTSNAAIQAQVKRNQQALDAENVSTANAVETIRQVDEEKRKASGLNDTGLREDAPSGATREPTTGKGTYHLVTPAIGMVLGDILEEGRNLGLVESNANNCLMEAIVLAYKWLANKDIYYLDAAIEQVIYACGWECGDDTNSIANALMRLAKHYERGAAKYDSRNWEKGLSCSRCFDSGIRHMVRYIDGDRSEDHLAAAIWNLVGIQHYLMFGYYKDIEGVLDLDMPWRGTQQKVREEEL